MSTEPRGFSFPFRIDPGTGGWARAEGAEKLKENVVHLLLTGIGERMMRRDYGGGLQALVHDPNNDALKAIVQRQVSRAIAVHEPRIEVRSLRVVQHEGMLHAELIYQVRGTPEQDRVALPIPALGAT
ncbi:MAG: hypothetical protein EA350_03815 [Gemmatimonadales bacterium]|nr:MAG: hypothetical protein EA350_03815 [Gemmatimonadales bacterium]